MSVLKSITRRQFLSMTGLSVAGLTLGAGALSAAENEGKQATFAPNVFINIAPDNRITLWVKRPEIGQGTKTGLAMALAEELEVELAQVDVKLASTLPKFGWIGVGGSYGLQSHFNLMLRSGAAAKTMLLAAAAAGWGVPATECRASRGEVIHVPTGKRKTYGQLVAAANEREVPESPQLKPAEEYRLIGKPLKSLDHLAMVTGKMQYGLDLKLPGQVYASIERCPYANGQLKSLDKCAALGVDGVLDVIEQEGTGFPHSHHVRAGVAVIADSHWAAMKGRQSLAIEWSNPDEHLSSSSLKTTFKNALASETYTGFETGDYEGKLSTAQETLEATYQLPFLAHAPMETPNATALVTDQACNVWCGIQSAWNLQARLGELFSLPPEQVFIHPMQCGGSFGRRLNIEYGIEAALLSRRVGRPVQVLWTREDDIKQGIHRPASMHKLQATLSEQQLTGISDKVALVDPELQVGGDGVKSIPGVDVYYFDGRELHTQYGFETMKMQQALIEAAVPVGWWRGVSSTNYCFAYESFVDELAHKLALDPLALRKSWLLAERDRRQQRWPLPADAEYEEHDVDPAYQQRIIDVLDRAAERANWGRELPSHKAQGLSVFVFGSRTAVATVADISIVDSQVKVTRITLAVECGLCVNPDLVEAQLQGGSVWALSTLFDQEITIDAGAVVEDNFHNFPPSRLIGIPEIDISILSSQRSPQGVGEVAVPGLAPAVANAIFRATGRRLRTLPMSRKLA